MELIETAALPVAMVGLLYALPNTQLTRRLHKEGRLFVTEGTRETDQVHGDQCTAGLNFRLKRPRREVLSDYRAVLDQIYPAEQFFGRVRRVAEMLKMPVRPRGVAARAALREAARFLRLLTGVTLTRPDMRRPFWSMLVHVLRRNPAALPSAVRLAALYLHLGPFSLYVRAQIDGQMASIDEGTWAEPAILPWRPEAQAA